MEIAGNDIQAQAMDHHGLIAAICQELKLAEKINARLGAPDPRRAVSAGTAVVAMILNGLGFSNRRLYLTHQFFANKPVEKLLGPGVTAEAITDHTLGQALDEIAAFGSSQLFAEIAFEVASGEGLLHRHAHLDTTSLSVHGQYEREDPAQTIEITYGHSKDHRPDLKQVMLSLVVNGPSALPLWMDALDGNSSDKVSFHRTIERVEHFRRHLQVDTSFKWIADSALYSKDKLLESNDYDWVSRVPETISEAKQLAQKPDDQIRWSEHPQGYRSAYFTSCYGGIEQRWLLVFSEQAYQREQATLEKKLAQQEERLTKALWHLQNQAFACEADAQKALQPIGKKYPLFVIDSEVEAIEKHARRGRPKADAKKIVSGYRVVSHYHRDEAAIQRQLNTKGRFILATNVLDQQAYPDEQLLADYKDQQSVERGFRFLKDPWFMIDSIFLKSPRRIEALMMVMTLCLLVYNLGQHRLRQTLKQQNQTLPNQLKKPVQHPTMRWIFQLMEGISVVRIVIDASQHLVKEIITGFSSLRQKIVRLFGKTACRMYGLIPETPT
jgi:transposase